MSNAELTAKIQALATQLEEVDSDAARRLRDIQAALEETPPRRDLAYLDARAILDPQGIEERVVVRRRPGYLSWIEWLRNVLVLFPIAFTWIGLSQASANYERVITLYPNLIDQPFLLLWERGFQELGGRHGPTFSEVALVDFLVLSVVILLTVMVHRWRDVQETRAEREAAELRSQVEEIIWDLDRYVAAQRSSQDVNQLAITMSEAVDRFRIHANELLDLMLAERQRLESIAASREQELDHLQLVGEAATKLTQYGQSVEQVYERLQSSIDRFSDEIQRVGQQQELLLRALDSADVGSHEMAEAVRVLRQSLATAVSELGVAASRSSDNITSLATAIDEMRDLASRLMEEDTALRRALLETREAHREITRNLQTATSEFRDTTSINQIAASTLRQAVGELTRLIQSNAEMSRQLTQSAEQMSRAAEDLSATTYQAINQLKSTATVNQQTISALAHVADELTRAIQAHASLAQQLAQSAGQIVRVSDSLSTATETAGATFRELQPATSDLRGAIDMLSEQTRRLSELISSPDQAGARWLLYRGRPAYATPAPRSRLLFLGIGLGFGLGVGAGAYILLMIGLLPVLR
jgi:chromosome segregation ATPase